MCFISALPFEWFYQVYASVNVPYLMMYIIKNFPHLNYKDISSRKCVYFLPHYMSQNASLNNNHMYHSKHVENVLLLPDEDDSYCYTLNTQFILAKEGSEMYLSSSDCYPQHTTDLLFLHSHLIFRMVNAFPSDPFSMSSLPQTAFCSFSCVVTFR